MRGTVETAERIDSAVLKAFHAAHVTPSSPVAGASSAISNRVVLVDAASACVRCVEGREPGADVEFPPVPAAVGRRTRVIPMMNKSQADIAYGFTTITRSDPAYYAYWLMNNILGQYSLGGRLGDSIRERQGMAYYVFSSLDANVAAWSADRSRRRQSCERRPRGRRRSTPSWRSWSASGPTEQEVIESKQYLIGSLPRTLETNAGIATFLQTVEFFGLGLDYDVRVPGLLQAVTRDARARCGATRRRSVEGRGRRRRAVSTDRCRECVTAVSAVFFDVDFTLIYPGPTFQGEGYARFCAAARHHASTRPASTGRSRGLVDSGRGAGARVRRAKSSSATPVESSRRWAAAVRTSSDCAREIYEEWAACQHFFLYDDVAPVLRELASRGLKIGLISNSHRCLSSFQQHFELEGLITAAVSSSEHGYMKPHPSIFTAALTLAGVRRERIGDGGGQPHARHRGRAAGRHARRACAPLRRSRASGRCSFDPVDD